MSENFEIIKRTFQEFQGEGAYVTLYLLALVYLVIKEKDKKNRMFFIYFQALVLLVVLNPIFNKIISPIFKESVYWRVFWIIPFGITIGYSAVKLISELEYKNIKKITVIASFIFIIIMSGKFIYTDWNYTKVGNLYRLSDEDVRIAQVIAADEGEYKKAFVPETLVPHLRQVESSILLPYKREPAGYGPNNKFAATINTGNTKAIAELAKESKCNYIAVKREIPLTEEFSIYGFEDFFETQNYFIFKLVEDK